MIVLFYFYWDARTRKGANMNITEKLSLGKTLKVQRVLKDMSVQDSNAQKRESQPVPMTTLKVDEPKAHPC